MTVRDTIFDSNVANAHGGGLYLDWVEGATTLERVTFMGNTAGSIGGGLAFEETSGISITDSVFRNNTVTAGGGAGIGALEVTAPLVITGSSFTGNNATGVDLVGSALFAETVSAPLVLSNSAVMGNTADSEELLRAGAVAIGVLEAPGTVLLDSSTVADNPMALGGDTVGAVGLIVDEIEDGATVDILNSTFRELTTSVAVAVMIGASLGEVTVTHSTLESFIGVLAIFVGDPSNAPDPLPGSVLIENSILSRAIVLPEGEDIPNAIASLGAFDIRHNLFTGYTEAELYNDLGGNLFRVDPLLGPLQDNGGATPTMLPDPGSPAIDAGSAVAVAPVFDQRGDGYPRVVAGRVDMGAVETAAVVPTPTPTPTPSPSIVPEPTPSATALPAAADVIPPTGQTLPLGLVIVGLVLLLGGIAASSVCALGSRRQGQLR